MLSVNCSDKMKCVQLHLVGYLSTWVRLVQRRTQQWAVVKTTENLQVPWNAGSFLLTEKLPAQQEVCPMKLSYTFRCISHEMPKQQTRRTIALTAQETTSETSSYAV